MPSRQPIPPSPTLVGLRVRVYLNLHQPGHLSVVALEGPNKGKVVAHTLAVVLDDCQFAVSESGRQRVIREQSKNVHAAIRGVVTAIACSPEERSDFERRADELLIQGCPVYYNPYRTALFLNRKTDKPLHNAAKVIAIGSRVVALPG